MFQHKYTSNNVQADVKSELPPGLSQGGVHGEMVISVRLGSRCHTDQPPNYPGGKRRSRVWGWGVDWAGRRASSAASTRPPKAMESAVCSTIKILIDNLLQWLVTACSNLMDDHKPASRVEM